MEAARAWLFSVYCAKGKGEGRKRVSPAGGAAEGRRGKCPPSPAGRAWGEGAQASVRTGKECKNGRQFRGRRLSPAPGKKAGLLGFLSPGVRAWPCWAAPARAQPRALIPLPPAASLAPAVCAAEIRRRRGPARPDKRLGHCGPNDSF